MSEADVAKIQGILIGWIALVQNGDGEANDGHLERLAIFPCLANRSRTKSHPMTVPADILHGQVAKCQTST